MARAGRPETVDLISALRDDASRFEFFQAVRLVQWGALRAGSQARIGGQTPADAEHVRITTVTGLSFPSSAVAEAQPAMRESESPAALRTRHSDESGTAAEIADRSGPTTVDRMHLRASFMGLTGPMGVLPHPFSSLVIEQYRANDPRLQVFLDFFNHRALSLFYRAWEKHRLTPAFERRRISGQPLLGDVTCRGALALGGFGTGDLAQRWAASDELLLFFGGDWARRSRPVDGLQRIVADLLGAPVHIESFVGQWLTIPPESRATLRSPRMGVGSVEPPRLGMNLTVGAETWTIHTRFAVVVGPLTFAEYQRLLPGGRGLQSLAEVVRRYVGPELDFEVRLILKREEVPGAKLGLGGAQLGWTSFMNAETPPTDLVGARFEFVQIDYPAVYQAAAG